ncbi:sugar phosphate isomerase/epimerase family protein [uncultured Sphaerochaeta sp.]|uniref:sugar phosphate isomerase/epimerase family protein n=1 Tax=uncultured Sphaerochaeta sp. TaxID=886478 RepID=UPI002A0A47C2|nr:sugar phosphate isomerase/epimerase family protein [uncultured Sphaerochaeta sp.]
MKLAGHTMGTPEYSLKDAMQLFSEIGMDGVEIVYQDNYGCGIPTSATATELLELRDYAEQQGLSIVALTPYFSHFNNLNEKIRKADVRGMKKVIEDANTLGATYIRVYGGNYTATDSMHRQEMEDILVESLQELGWYAQKAGVMLVVENHFNTMTVSAKESIEISKAISNPAVGILYDQANLTFTGNEDYEEALELQMEKVLYTHVKDFLFKGIDHTFASSDVAHPKEEERNVVTKIVGKGVIPWKSILEKMKAYGYDNWLSFEYERRWHPKDIPDARIGMKASAEYIKKCLKDLS